LPAGINRRKKYIALKYVGNIKKIKNIKNIKNREPTGSLKFL